MFQIMFISRTHIVTYYKLPALTILQYSRYCTQSKVYQLTYIVLLAFIFMNCSCLWSCICITTFWLTVLLLHWLLLIFVHLFKLHNTYLHLYWSIYVITKVMKVIKIIYSVKANDLLLVNKMTFFSLGNDF